MRSYYIKLAILLWSQIVCIEAFSVSVVRRSPPSRVSHRRAAYIYGEDGTEDGDNTLWGGLFGESERSDPSAAGAVEAISQQKAALARVVAAFPPVGHALELSQIEDITVSAVDEQHFHVQVTLCEGESCAAVDVPVTFPHPCDASTSLDACVLANFDELDQQASLLLQHAEWNAHSQHGSESHENDNLLEITNEQVMLPTWWVTPDSSELAAECSTLRQLFNEDEYDSEVRLLAKFGLGPASLEVVNDAVVCAVGPAGIIMEAHLFPEGATDGIFNPDGLVLIPIAFPTVASNVYELRRNALSTLDLASR